MAAAGVAAAGLAFGINWLLVNMSGVTAYDLPLPVIGWIAVAVLALLLMVLNQFSSRWWRKVLAPVAMMVLVLTAALQVNVYFGAYRTVGDLTGTSTAGIAALPPSTAQPPGRPFRPAPAGVLGPVVDRWTPPVGLPTAGTVNSVQIPGTVSGFTARTGYVYLPPAYQAAARPQLPVLVLISGQPGSPSDWLTAGQLKNLMDAFAAAHSGLSPVVVVPDVNGSASGNTMCMDSRIARADTYLSVDVPAWIKNSLSVDPDPQRWTIGGFSFGGTCAIQMAALHPDIYPSAIDFSGEAEPALTADRTATVRQGFGENTAAFNALTPLNVMARTRYAHSRAYFAAGGLDGTFTGHMNQVAAAAKQAGMEVKTALVPGVGHAWGVPLQSLNPALQWLGTWLGLTGKTPAG